MNHRPLASTPEGIVGRDDPGIRPARDLLRLIPRGLLNGAGVLSGLTALLTLGFAVEQWLHPPILIMPFTIDAGTKVAGISAEALADQTKAHISAIYAASNQLFQTRKLGEPTAALNVKLGSTGLTPQGLADLLSLPLYAAEVTGRIAPDGTRLLVQWTTVEPGGISVTDYPIDAAGTSPLADIDTALACLALRTVARISPDVAANYLHKLDEASDAAPATGAAPRCIEQDDAVLYSSVSKDDSVPAPARVNALVGLSVHFSYLHEYSEELTMALAANHLASRLLTCDDRVALSSRWERFSCRVGAYRPFSDKPRLAATAAAMQLGAAFSDSAGAAATLGEMQELRTQAIQAYDRAIAIDADHAPAYDARGLQQSLSGLRSDAAESYRRSFLIKDLAAARIDRAFLALHGRSDSFEERALGTDELTNAEADFRRAIELSPDYWDAHAGLGYALHLQGRRREAVEDIETAISHDAGNRPLRRLLGTAYADLCRFDAARSNYREAFATPPVNGAADDARDLATDWSGVLRRFGLTPWAFVQAQGVLRSRPGDPQARAALGAAALELSQGDATVIEYGLAALKGAVDDDAAKSDAVLNAYLVGLGTVGHFADAVAVYEDWGRSGLVAPAAAPMLAESATQPVRPQARLSYARALVEVGRWTDALREFEVLAATGFTPAATDVAALRSHAANAGTDAADLSRIQALQVSSLPVRADPPAPCAPPPPEPSIWLPGTVS